LNSRTYVATSAGVTAGVLGFNGITGFLFYIVIFLIASVFLAMKCNFNIKKYFSSSSEVYTSGLSKDMIVRIFSIFDLINSSYIS